MKTSGIVQTVALAAIVVLITSCASRRYEPYPPPPPRVSASLIINAGPGMVISRYNDGRYYYRNPQGWIYWRGPGNRYYLDQRYMQRSYRSYPQYREWNRHYDRRRWR
ncbi:hypothetical protein LZZ85_20510 [Terrimonas sp. NA20]|uniref:Lipoprotein n=1 Tax=Terrimonas ginsenosidimutans TaxID=2908004 RepID=A0ABS9KWM5_9BACT|nr:hypothetical protein [Terrimonas ginsenosidimutans]MCG2616693.1 hypothetical protein [Terrimonas ginsenosidimutans]